MAARVESLIREPTPYAPPLQPVLISQTFVLCLRDSLGKQLGVLARMPDEERAAEAGRKRRLRLGHADFGAGDFGRVTADEVVLGLLRRQPADRRQHAEGVAGQKDDIGRMIGDARNLGVGDELDRIGSRGCFR